MKIIKIGAIWCSSCLVMKPIWKSIDKKYPNLNTEYYEYDDNIEIIKAKNIDINRMPTFIFESNENIELARLTGEVQEKDIIELIEKYKNK